MTNWGQWFVPDNTVNEVCCCEPCTLLRPLAGTVTALPRGWARPVARDKEHLDDTAVRLITQWFENV